MNAIKLWLLVVFLAGFSYPAAADTNFTLKYEGWGRYHGANGSEFDDDLSNQLSLFALRKTGWYTAIWVSADFDSESDFGDEVDVNFGKLGQYHGLNYDVGAQYFFIHQPTSDSGDVVNLYAGLSKGFDTGAWSHNAYARWDYYFPVGGEQPGAGNVVKFGLAMSRELSGQWSVTLDPHLKVDDGAFDFDSNLLGFFDGLLTYKVTDSHSISLLTRFSKPLEDDSSRSSLTTYGLQWVSQF